MTETARVLIGLAAAACVAGPSTLLRASQSNVAAAESRGASATEAQAVAAIPSNERCTAIVSQRAVIADEIASIDRQLREATVKAFIDAITRRRSELLRDDARLRTERASCPETPRPGTATPSSAPLTPPAAAIGMPPSPPIPNPTDLPAATTTGPPATPAAVPPTRLPVALAATTPRAMRDDLCTLMPEGFTIGEGNEPTNNPKKARPGVPRYCEGAGSAQGSAYVAVSVYAFADVAAAAAEIEGYRRRPGNREASASTAAGDAALEDTDKKGGGGDEYMLAFSRGTYFVYVQGIGPKIPDAKQIAVQIDTALKTWGSPR